MHDVQGVDRTPTTRVGAGRRTARPPAVAPRSAAVLGLQRAAGNRAVSQALVQRQVRTVSVGPVRLSPDRVSIPVAAGVTVFASVPRSQGVTWSLLPGTAAVDASTTVDPGGRLNLGVAQAGGTITLQATDASGSGATATMELGLVKAPGSIIVTAETGGAGAQDYGAAFRHTFAPVGGGAPSECAGGRVTEIFADAPNPGGTSHRMTTVLGSFTLTSNNPAAVTGGWGVDDSGQMTGDDHVTIGRAGVDVRPFVPNTSNPAPGALPVSFSVAQSLRSLVHPGNTWRAPFSVVPHVRGLRVTGSTVQVFVSANGVEHVDDYAGRPAARKVSVSPVAVVASEGCLPRPAGSRTQPPAPSPEVAQVSAESLPDGAPLRFAIIGPALGCRIDARTGELTVGTTAGVVRVRAQTDATSYDEVVVTIAPRPAPAVPSGPGAAPG